MSKVDAQRAMREARYARLRASGPTRREEAAARGAGAEVPAPAVAAPSPAAPVRARKPAAGPATEAPAGTDVLCGHQSISGRTCTREAGHPQKSHRYG